MNRSRIAWLLVILLGAIVPVGLRVLSWRNPKLEIDEAMASAGGALFNHVWKANDPLAPGGDGLGPVYNADSCVACHHQRGVGGAGGLANNVTVFSARPANGASKPVEGVIHAEATSAKFQETMATVSTGAPATSRPSLRELGVSGPACGPSMLSSSAVQFSQRNTPALFGAKLIDEIPDRDIIALERREHLGTGMASPADESLPVGRASRLPDGRVGKFGWKAQIASLSDFVQAACANELGLGNPGQTQPRSLARPSYQPRGLDLSLEQCDQLTMFVASLPRPLEQAPKDPAQQEQARRGKDLFTSTGCASCHTPSLGSVDGIYSDLLLHRMGRELQAAGRSYDPHQPPLPDEPPDDDPQPEEWRTPPLWGVADSAPYLHDGRAATLEAAIRQHGGQGARARDRFSRLTEAERSQLVAFLKTLRAPGAERVGALKVAAGGGPANRF
jgi:CxxC motif-containing protein (DUF1111 family)